MSSTIMPLPSPWNDYLQYIDRISITFWEQRTWPPDPVRRQNMEIWRELRRMLGKITSELVPKTNSLTSVELFLLDAAACLYETGWQTPYALQLPVKKRYVESGCLIRNSTVPSTKLELSYLETATLNALACISSSPSLDDLSTLPLSPEPVGLGETASLRYLSALFQLADYLFIRRVNKRTMQNLTNPEILDPLNARLLLQPYLPFVYIQPNGITASFELHPDDQHLAAKMNALFTDPIQLWWERNSIWLNEQFQFSFTLHAPRIKIIQNAAVPDPLAITSKAFLAFLEQYIPQNTQKPFQNIKINFDYNSKIFIKNEQNITLSKDTESVPARANTKRTKAFISYSHQDHKYLKELRTHLKPYNVDVWDATQITVGSKWHEEIDHALHTTKVAIMLVSAHFLASDFIDKNELPPLLTAAEREGAIIVSVIISPCAFKRSPLAEFGTVNPPDKPLNLMKRSGERDLVWNKVAELVKDALTGLS